MKRLTSTIENEKWLRHALATVLIIIYTAVFCVLSFSPMLRPVCSGVEDTLLQRGVAFSDNVRIIGITAGDMDKYESDPSAIASSVALALNSGEEYPAAICIDVSRHFLNDETKEKLLRAASACNNIVLPVDLTIDEDCVIDYYDLSDNGIRASNAYSPQGRLCEVCRTGHTTKLLDSDGILRHAVFDISAADGKAYPSMAYVCYEMFCEANGITPKLPAMSEQNTAAIKFAAPDSSQPVCNAEELLEGEYDTSSFAGKIVYIGCCDTCVDSGYLTAIDHQDRMHSVEIDANITSALFTGSFALSIHPVIQVCVLAVSIIILNLFVFTNSLFPSICICILYLLLDRVLAMLLYGVGYIGHSTPHIVNAFLTCTLGISLSIALRSQRSRKKLEAVLIKYMDDSVAKSIIKEAHDSEGISHTDLKNVSTHNITVLFADIRNFTALSEKISANQIVSILNSYLSMMSECINKYGGTVDKFIGDCAMGYWGAPTIDDDSVYHACLAADEMQRRAAELSKSVKAIYGYDVTIGIGINYGEAVVGNIGSSDRMNFTVIGDSVNTASRLESLAPAGCIYISDSAFNMLGNRAEVERLSEEKRIKGKEKSVSVYRLKSISAGESRKQQAAAKNRSLSNSFERRGPVSILADILLVIILFLFTLNGIREMGILFATFYTVALSLISCITVIVMIPFDIKAMSRADGINIRPRSVDVLMLAGLTAEIEVLLIFLFYALPNYSVHALTGGTWPGGYLVNLVCPLLSLFSFFVLESRRKYRLSDIVFAIIPLVGLRILWGYANQRMGLAEVNPQMFNLFYEFPHSLILSLSELLILLLICLASKKTALQDSFWSRYSRNYKAKSGRISKLHISRLMSNERSRLIAAFIANILITVLSMRTVVKSYYAGGIDIYSNPSLVGILVSVACITSEFYIIDALRKGGSIRNLSVYKYFSFAKAFGCAVNFMTVFMLFISGDGIRVFFEPRWQSDATVFLLCPAISMYMCLSEKNEYKAYKCFLTALPFALIPVLSKTAIVTSGLYRQYAFEYNNFYNGRIILVITVGELLTSIVLYFLNANLVKLKRNVEMPVSLTVCGCRSGISPGKLKNSEYGLRSDCFVLRDRNYAIIINAGSGLAKAKTLLAGCDRVDILLASSDFSSLMGFLEITDLCVDAKVRIFSVFDVSAFSVKPFWPVNLVVNNKCIQVQAGKKTRLNSDYSATFVPLDDKGTSFMLRISGAASIVYVGKTSFSPEKLRTLVTGSELLIYNGHDDFNINACYLAIDCNIPSLLISGYSSGLDDSELSEMRQSAEKILPEVNFAHDGLVFPIR